MLYDLHGHPSILDQHSTCWVEAASFLAGSPQPLLGPKTSLMSWGMLLHEPAPSAGWLLVRVRRAWVSGCLSEVVRPDRGRCQFPVPVQHPWQRPVAPTGTAVLTPAEASPRLAMPAAA